MRCSAPVTISFRFRSSYHTLWPYFFNSSNGLAISRAPFSATSHQGTRLFALRNSSRQTFSPTPPPLPFVVRLSNDERQHSPRLPCLRLPYLSLTLTHQPSAITLSLAGSPAHRRRRSPFVVRLSNHDRST